MSWKTMLAGVLAGALSLTAGTALAAKDKRVALVLGNGRYVATGEVAAVGGNTVAMTAALRRAGFTVTRADNLGRIAMESALAGFRDALAGADLGFVYYSGLAVGVSDREFLLPVDAALGSDGDPSRGAVDLDTVLSALHEVGRKTVVVIDPAGGYPPAGSGPGGSPLGPPLDVDGLFVIYAHRPGVPPAVPVGKGADTFTTALAREMTKPGVPLRDSLAEVARAVAEHSEGRQLPWLQDRLGGDLVLVPAVVAGIKPPTKEAPTREAGVGVAKDEVAKERPAVTASALPPGAYAAVRGGVLFDRPAVGARGLKPLAPGDPLTVIEAVPNGSWVRVRDAAGRVGYVTAGTLSERWGEPPPPVAALPRGVIEAGPSLGQSAPESPAVAALPPSGASDPQGDSPAVQAEQRAMRALGSARTAAEQARDRRDNHYWSFQFTNGDRYEGAWLAQGTGQGASALGHPSRQGFGVYRFANGQTYEGEWARDLMSGYGVMTFVDGSRFAGLFRDGQPDGPGVYRFSDGSQSAGLWRGSVKQDD